jgi:hypothetical protein
MSDPALSALAVFLPDKTLEYFDIITASTDDNHVYITLAEKDEPPINDRDHHLKITSKGFHDITITDFPIRGKRSLLTFRRRYWQSEGQKELLKRDIPLTFEGTQLEQEFARFLKEDGGRTSGLTGCYRRVSSPPDQRI